MHSLKNGSLTGAASKCNWHRRKESNPHLRFWRPMRYHYTTPVRPIYSSNTLSSAQPHPQLTRIHVAQPVTPNVPAASNSVGTNSNICAKTHNFS